MAITLQQLCEDSNYLYGMRLLAGYEGMKNIVQWVHTLEDVEVSVFLHGGELIFSTGIANKGTDWLLPFVKNLRDNQASGLVINLGPYIPQIPDNVIEFCNDNAFPLFDVPWKTRLVDITRDFCNQIIKNDKAEEDIGTVFKNIIYNPGEVERYLPTLDRHGFNVRGDYCIIGVYITNVAGDRSFMSKTRFEMERIIYGYKKSIGCFQANNIFYFVLCNFTDDEISQIADKFANIKINSREEYQRFIAVGPQRSEILALSRSFKKTSSLVAWAKKEKETLLFYDKMGVKKVLFSVDDIGVLKDYYHENLEVLEIYDLENGTDYTTFLRKYLEFDGSVKKVAECTYVHRNTINYQLNKIKKILGNEMKTLQDRFKIMLAFHIKDVL